MVQAVAAEPVAAATVCRPTALGSVTCRGPAVRPLPRPPLASDVQALERLPDAAPPAGTRFVPARRTNRLGTTTIDGGGAVPGRCRPDALGNLRCR